MNKPLYNPNDEDLSLSKEFLDGEAAFYQGQPLGEDRCEEWKRGWVSAQEEMRSWSVRCRT